MTELDKKIESLTESLAGFKKENSAISIELEQMKKRDFENKIWRAFKVLVQGKKQKYFNTIRKCQLFNDRREKLIKLSQVFERH